MGVWEDVGMTFYRITREGVSYIGIDVTHEREDACRFICNLFGYYLNVFIPIKLPCFYWERGKWTGGKINP